MTELHIVEARRHALDLFTLSSAVYPKEWQSYISERVISSVFDFASHAYRINELCEFGDNEFKGSAACRFKLDNVSGDFEDNYVFAIHKVRHSRDITVGWAKRTNEKVFLLSQGDYVAAYLILKGNRHPGCISLFGVPFVYLTEVIINIKNKYPELSF